MFDIAANDDIESDGDMNNGAFTNLSASFRTALTPFCLCDDDGTKAAVLAENTRQFDRDNIIIFLMNNNNAQISNNIVSSNL